MPRETPTQPVRPKPVSALPRKRRGDLEPRPQSKTKGKGAPSRPRAYRDMKGKPSEKVDGTSALTRPQSSVETNGPPLGNVAGSPPTNAPGILCSIIYIMQLCVMGERRQCERLQVAVELPFPSSKVAFNQIPQSVFRERPVMAEISSHRWPSEGARLQRVTTVITLREHVALFEADHRLAKGKLQSIAPGQNITATHQAGHYSCQSAVLRGSASLDREPRSVRRQRESWRT